MSNFHDNNTNYSNYNGYPNNPNNPNDFSGGGNRNGRHSNAVVIVSIALVMLILGGLLGVVIVQGMNSQQAQLGSEVTATPEATATPAPTQQAQAVSGGATTSLAALSDQIADVVASVQDSVVGIHNYQTVTTGGNYGGYFGGFYFPYYGGGDSEPQTVEQLAGSGSGVIYSADGYIITNYHVIEGASRVTVVLHSGEEIEAEVIGGDELQDIALLKVDRTDLSPATLGDSDQVRTGEFAIAIGSPLGDELSGTTTYGIISYANRTLEVDGAYLSMIQTDAAINAGNSGGALLNVDGEVIGINSRKTSGSTSSGSTIEGIGFAIPINDVKDIVEELIATGKITRPGLGITGQEVHFSNMDPGILVVSVNEGSPAEAAGMKQMDIITAIDGQTVLSSAELVEAKKDYKAGDTMQIKLLHEIVEQVMQIACPEKAVDYQDSQEQIIRHVHDELTANLAERVTIEELSRKYLMNTTTLKRCFKQVYGETIAAHMKKHRMEQAASLLLKTQNDIAAIAQAVGYESQSRFTAAFKETYGELPTEYRRRRS